MYKKVDKSFGSDVLCSVQSQYVEEVFIRNLKVLYLNMGILPNEGDGHILSLDANSINTDFTHLSVSADRYFAVSWCRESTAARCRHPHTPRCQFTNTRTSSWGDTVCLLTSIHLTFEYCQLIYSPGTFVSDVFSVCTSMPEPSAGPSTQPQAFSLY